MNQERLMSVLVSPHISEKATIAAEFNNQYVFKVVKDAKKPEVKAAVELMFGVKVSNVNVLVRKGKNKRFGRHTGRRNDTKIAYVRLEEGQSIDFTDGEK